MSATSSAKPTNLLLIHSIVSNDNQQLESLETSVLAKNKKKYWLKRELGKAAANSLIVRKERKQVFSETDFYQRLESLGGRSSSPCGMWVEIMNWPKIVSIFQLPGQNPPNSIHHTKFFFCSCHTMLSTTLPPPKSCQMA
jgi:hypothetical protein